MSNPTKNAAYLVSSAILGEDFKVVLINNERFVIHPPTIERLAGAALHLSQFDTEDMALNKIILSADMMEAAARALSWFVRGNEDAWQRIAKGTPQEITAALYEAYSLVDVTPFSKLLVLARNVSRLTAHSRQ